MVRLRAVEPTLPTDANILTLLNAGLEQVNAELGAARLYKAFLTTVNQNIVTLSSDIQDIISASWSTGDPTSPGVMVYNLQQLDQASFMDAAGGFPATGGGPPVGYFLSQDFGSGPLGPLPPPPVPATSTVAGTSAGYTAYLVTTYTNAAGETTPSGQSSQTVDTAHQVQVASPPAFGNATGYNTYASTTFGGPYYKQNGSPTAIGTAFTVPGTLLTVTPAPTANTATGYASGGAMTMQLYPPAMQGQVNVYYRGRPQLWADATANSWTNVDTVLQEAVLLWTIARTLESRGRGDEARDLFQPQYDQTMQKLKDQIARRTAPKTGRVRDVTGVGYNTFPTFWRL